MHRQRVIGTLALALALLLGTPRARGDDDPVSGDDRAAEEGEGADADPDRVDSPSVGEADPFDGEVESTDGADVEGDPAAERPGDTPSTGGAIEPARPAPVPSSDGSSATPTGDAWSEDDGAPAGIQEIGARLGLVAGGRTTPGGFLVAGVYLYQMSEVDWFEGVVSFSLGGGAAACFRDREDRYLCDHDALSGISGGISLGVRRFLVARQRFTPYLGAGLEGRYASFGDDGVKGLAVPAWLSAGVRARVTDSIAIAADARYQFGIGWFNHELGLEPQAALVVGVGVDFRLE